MPLDMGVLKKWVYGSLAVLVLLIVPAGAALAQSDTGTITGTVTDQKGLAMTGVTVLVHNADTGADQKPILTTDAGIYVMTLLPPGNYDVTASQGGFASVQRKGIMLEVGQTVRIDFEMPVAAQQSLVTVTTEVPVLETEKTENSQNINEDLVTNLPVSSRRWEQLALLTPGVSYDGVLGAVSFRGLGGEYNQNSVDGANNEDSYDETTRGGYNESYVYSSDSIREFQVASSGFNAELGQAAGGSVNAVTKSGTAMYHGDLFYSGRSPSFNAYDPVGKTQAASTGQTPTQPVHQQDQWGGSFGGPLIKNKLFFFVTDDGFRKVEPLTVTTPQLNPSIDGLACPNPATVTVAQCLAAKQFVDAHFIGVFPRDMRQDVELIKLDYQLSQSNHVSVVSNIRDYHLPESAAMLDPEATGGLASILQDRFLIANFTSVIGTDKVNEFRYQWGKDNSISPTNIAAPAPEVVLTNLFTYGNDDSSAYTDEVRNQFSDNFSITRGAHTIKFGADVNLVSDDVQGSVTADGPYTYNGGTLPAAVTAGGGCTPSLSAAQAANTTFCSWLIDLYRYNTGSASTTGNHFSSFGQTLDTVGQTPNNFVYNMPFQDVAGYVQDTWKARPNLTINYGLRYDAQLFPHLPYSVAEVFPAGDQPIFDYYTSKYPDTLNGFQPRLGVAWNFRKSTVLRIGGGEFIAETAGHNLKNVFSGAGESSVSCQAGQCTGITYPTPAGQPFAGLEFPDLFVSQNKDVPLANVPLAGVGAAQTLYTSAASAVTIPNPKFSIRGADPNLQAARAYEAELGIEQQLPWGMNLSVQYIFTRGNHLPRGQDGNIGGAYTPNLCSNAAGSGVIQNCGTNVTKPYYVTDANGNILLTPSSSSLLNLPLYSSAPVVGGFPGFTSRIDALTGGIPSNTSTINTLYNGMNVTLRKPMSHGLELLANYTLAHALDNGDVGGTQLATVALDPRNNSLEYGNSTTDVRNRFTASVVYAPTFFPDNSNKIAKNVVNGWALSTTITATNGVHYTGQASGSTSQTTVYCGAPGPTCDFTGFYLPGSTTLLPSPITFTGLGGGMTGAGIGSTGTPAGSRISWEPNGFYVLPNLYDVDLRLTRQFAIKERYHVEFRVEAFNLFNDTLVQAVNTTAYNYTKPTTVANPTICPAGAITCMTPSSTFQVPTQTSGNLLGARQFQAGVRFEF